MNPERILFSLVAIALVAAGFLYGDYWKKSGSGGGTDESLAELRAENLELVEENDALQEELAQVRSLLSGAPYPIPEDLISFVEKDLGLVFLKAPLAQLGSPNDLRDAAERNLELVYGEDGLGFQERTWELLGLLPPGQNLQGQWMMIETIGARGIFDLKDHRILLAENYDAGSIPDTGILVRLLARQLLFQNYPKSSWENEDEWNAWLATFRGAAVSCQSRYMRRRSSSQQAEFKNPEQDREDLLGQLSPAIQGLANFSFLEGHDFVQKHYLESRSALLGIFQKPPHSTLTVMRPDNPSPPQSPIPVATKGEHRNRVGALGLRLLLDEFFGMELSAKFANKWRNDAYVYEKDELTWYLKLSSPESMTELAKEFERSALPVLRKLQPSRVIEISTKGARMTLTNLPKKK